MNRHKNKEFRVRKQTQGFGVVPIVLIVVVIAIIATLVYVFFTRQDSDSQNTVETVDQDLTTDDDETVVEEEVLNDGYVAVDEWGIRFKIPEGLKDVEYVVRDNRLAFYAKPADADVEYRPDYQAFDGPEFPLHSIGVVERSSSSTHESFNGPVEGRRVGDSYYYTAWAFVPIATGASCMGLYVGDPDEMCVIEQRAFHLMNTGDGALINTIEAIK